MPQIKIGFGALAFLVLVLFCGGSPPVLLATLAALGMHEFAHIISGKLMGYRISELKLTPWGGRMQLDSGFGMEPGSEAWIAAAGPAINFLMVAGVYYLSLLNFAPPPLFIWGRLNLLIGGINLIPAFPLDGGRIIHAFLTARLGLSQAGRYCRMLNWIIACFTLALGAAQIIRDPEGLIPLLVGFSILCRSFGDPLPEVFVTRQLLERKKKKLANQGFLKIKPILVSMNTPVRVPLEHCRTSDYLLFMIADSKGKVGFIPEETAWEGLLISGFDARFGQCLSSAAVNKAQATVGQ